MRFKSCNDVMAFSFVNLGEQWLTLCGSSWKLCSHKKAVAVALFFIVWSFSSTLYRVWAGNRFELKTRSYEFQSMV